MNKGKLILLQELLSELEYSKTENFITFAEASEVMEVLNLVSRKLGPDDPTLIKD